MEQNGFRWNAHTFTKVLNACSSLKCLKLGKEFHAKMLKQMINLNSNPPKTTLRDHRTNKDYAIANCNLPGCQPSVTE
ncbi:hypothetical protein Hanom_Chr09g00871151 [Helianthus anomalus]